MKTRVVDQVTNQERSATRAEELKIQAESIIESNKGLYKSTLKELSRQVKFPLNQPDLLDPMYLLCRKLIPRSEEFKVIVSDEGSGRLVSLLVKDLFDRRRLAPIPITFILGGRMTPSQRKKVSEHFARHRSELDHALIVSEYLESGNSMAKFLADFRQQNLQATVATISALESSEEYRQLFSEELIVGQLRSSSGLQLYREPDATGVEKRSAEGPFPDRIKDEAESLTKAEKISIQRPINQARRDIALIAEVFDRLLKSNEVS